MTEITKFTHEDTQTVEVAAGLAWGALKAWHGARDIKTPTNAATCQDMAEDILREWIGQEHQDICEAVAVEIVTRLGFRPLSDMNSALLERIA